MLDLSTKMSYPKLWSHVFVTKWLDKLYKKMVEHEEHTRDKLRATKTKQPTIQDRCPGIGSPLRVPPRACKPKATPNPQKETKDLWAYETFCAQVQLHV